MKNINIKMNMNTEANDTESLLSVSPIDGRYRGDTRELSHFFSEYAFIKYRLHVEIVYLIRFLQFTDNKYYIKDSRQYLHSILMQINNQFNIEECKKVKTIEVRTKHDVKAIEYYIRHKLEAYNLQVLSPYIHFGLTSQDINSVANMLSIKNCIFHAYLPKMYEIMNSLKIMYEGNKQLPMLSKTHGQPATPTTLGKEMCVFHYRLAQELETLLDTKYRCKFGGAIGNFNAHLVAYPELDWLQFGDRFISDLGLLRNKYTTQISNYDELSCLLDNIKRINTILLDFTTDMWSYISLNYFTQKRNSDEIGSSTMPHKVNPIYFENCEGNLIISVSLIECLSRKLPISRLQRDLSDSTLMRNMGTIFGYSIISCNSLIKGLQKLETNKKAIIRDLNNNNAIIMEGIQTILRREGICDAYELTKEICHGKNSFTNEELQKFIDNLDVNDDVKNEIKDINVLNYTGYANL